MFVSSFVPTDTETYYNILFSKFIIHFCNRFILFQYIVKHILILRMWKSSYCSIKLYSNNWPIQFVISKIKKKKKSNFRTGFDSECVYFVLLLKSKSAYVHDVVRSELLFIYFSGPTEIMFQHPYWTESIFKHYT